MGIMKEISVKALAKINLGLDVVRRREDGYHEVKMVMQTIHLFDRLEMKKTAGGITMTTNLSFLPTNENNLVYKAAKLLMDEFQIRDGIDVKLHKYIPVAAGMAGGSTDAAAVLYGMNRMFELGLSYPGTGHKNFTLSNLHHGVLPITPCVMERAIVSYMIFKLELP